MPRNQASVNGSNSAPVDSVTMHARRFNKPFNKAVLTDAEWAVKQKLIYDVSSALKKVERERNRQKALRLSPGTAQRVAEARSRLKAIHARMAAANPKFTISFGSWLEFNAGTSPTARLVYAASCAPAFADMRKQKAIVLKAEVESRLQDGYYWRGGYVAGNEDYYRPAFRYQGLKSANHPLLQCYVSKLHRAKRLRVADDKAVTYSHPSKLIALDATYAEANKITCGILRLELDSVMPAWAIEDACNDLGVPLPNFVVGYDDEYGECHRPHLLWLLHHSIPLEGKQHAGNAALFRGVMRGLVKALLSIGADIGGLSNMHRHKNPVSPLWNCHIVAQQPHHLSDLAQAVDTTVTVTKLEELAAEIRGETAPGLVADHPDPEIATGSNTLFRQLATWARVEVAAQKAAGGGEEAFSICVADKACALAAALTGNAERSEPAALSVAKKVSAWTWNIYCLPGVATEPLPRTEVAIRQHDGAKKAAARKTERTRGMLIATAKSLAVEGMPPAQVDVFKALVAVGTELNEKTVRRHWPAVLSAFRNGNDVPDIRCPCVKKNQTSLLGSSLSEAPPLTPSLPRVAKLPFRAPHAPLPVCLILRSASPAALDDVPPECAHVKPETGPHYPYPGVPW